MASETDSSQISALFERLVRNRDMSLFLPFIFGFSDSSSQSRENTEDQEDGGTGTTDAPTRERIILVNPFTQGMVVIDGASSLEALFREIGINNGGKSGQPPASKESIESMPRVEVQEGEESGECVVCLEDFDVGVVVKEMPCKHRFHPNCIEKWLGIHGSCPVCRYVMPVEERDEGKKRDEEVEGGERRTRVSGSGSGSGSGEVWVSFSINRNRRSHEHEHDHDHDHDHDQNQAPSGGEGDSSPRGDDAEV